MIVSLFVALICYIFVQIVVNSKKESHDKLVKPSGNLLIFDTETNGLPKDWKASLYDTENWPRIVSIAWYKVSPNGQILSNSYFIIKPKDFLINSEATKIHNISNIEAHEKGVLLSKVIEFLQQEINDCKYLVAHNIDFDFAVLFAEYSRLGITQKGILSMQKICTMKKSTDFCKISSSKGYKYPKLNELYQKLFSTSIPNLHNAQTDADACMKCFKELYNQKIITF